MAIFSLNCRMVSRSKGKSAVGKAAYIGGRKLVDQRQQKPFDFQKKQREITYSKILAPANAPAWVFDPAVLWNKVEAAEKRVDAQTAREFIIALPLELNQEQRIHLIEDYVQENFVKLGMIADVNIHNIATNPHAHVLLTTRKLLSSEEFDKKERSWNKSDLLKTWRQMWKQFCNKHLKEAGVSIEINDASYNDRKIRKIPMLHMGSNSSTKNIKSEINKRVKSVNNLIKNAAHIFFKSTDIISETDKLLQFVEQNIEDNKLTSNKKINELKDNIISIKQTLSKRQQQPQEQPSTSALPVVPAFSQGG